MKYYYQIDEAAKFITKHKDTEMTETEVLDLALRGHFRLCVKIKGRVILTSCQYKDTFKHLIAVNIYFHGFIKIPQPNIDPSDKQLKIFEAEVIEALPTSDSETNFLQVIFSDERTIKYVQLLKDAEQFKKNVMFVIDEHTVSKLKARPIFVDLREAFVPTNDLLSFVKKTKGPSKKLLSRGSIEKELKKKRSGRPPSIKKDAKILRQIIEALTEGEKLNPFKLPGSADNLVDTCNYISRRKIRKNIFKISVNAFKDRVIEAGYGFGNGRTPSAEKEYWTNLCIKNIGKIDQSIFSDVNDKNTPHTLSTKDIVNNKT